MVDSAKQRYTFEVVTAAAFHIGDNHYDLAMLQTELRQLKECKVSGKELRMKYVFGCKGHPRFLVNLTKKDTRQKADGIIKEALGAQGEAKPWKTMGGEKFLPGARIKSVRSSKGDKRRGERDCSAFARSTIERYALQLFGDSDGIAYLLERSTCDTKEFLYTRAAGLVLSSSKEQPHILPPLAPVTAKQQNVPSLAVCEANAGMIGNKAQHVDCPSSLRSSATTQLTLKVTSIDLHSRGAGVVPSGDSGIARPKTPGMVQSLFIEAEKRQQHPRCDECFSDGCAELGPQKRQKADMLPYFWRISQAKFEGS